MRIENPRGKLKFAVPVQIPEWASPKIQKVIPKGRKVRLCGVMEPVKASEIDQEGLEVPLKRVSGKKGIKGLPKAESPLEALFELQLRASHIKFEREKELAIAFGKKYRWDFVVGDLAIEISGGIWVTSGHSTGRGITRDAAKGYYCLKAGFRPLTLTGDDVKSGEGLRRVQELMKEKKEWK